MAAQTMREGDWMCGGCNNHNYANREVCNRCQGPKAPTGGNTRPGDWSCPSCSNHNYARRETCNKCGIPKPGLGPSPGGRQGGYAAPKSIGTYANGQTAYAYQPAPQMAYQPPPQMAYQPVPQYHSAPHPSSGGGGATVRPGDWDCEACGNHNFASREVCNKCSGPQTDAGGGYGAVRGGGGGGRPAPSPYQLPQIYAPAPLQAQGNMRPGDWACPSCNNHNYASRENCNRCQRPKNTPPNFRDGDWMCPKCNNHNFASKNACNKCAEPKQ
mmetsp:Transcript_90253/g.162741  ORF Transcript_90253/g.162741 Transcript_90253/m.162741 type:complete len:271 (+) Transcript_90253:69-881(+)